MNDHLDEELRNRRTASGERRLPPVLAVVVAAVVYGLLPDALLFAPRLVIPGIELALILAVLIANPRELGRRSTWSRVATVVLACLMIATNFVALVTLVRTLNQSSTSSTALLTGAMQVWVTNVIGFGLLYWELDRGGPVARRFLRRDRLPAADWRFTQDEDADTVTEVAAGSSIKDGWVPTLVDYLYVSLTNSSAFSPTDTMPLSTRAKALMGLQSTTALLVTLVVIARAVGSLGS